MIDCTYCLRKMTYYGSDYNSYFFSKRFANTKDKQYVHILCENKSCTKRSSVYLNCSKYTVSYCFSFKYNDGFCVLEGYKSLNTTWVFNHNNIIIMRDTFKSINFDIDKNNMQFVKLYNKMLRRVYFK